MNKIQKMANFKGLIINQDKNMQYQEKETKKEDFYQVFILSKMKNKFFRKKCKFNKEKVYL